MIREHWFWFLLTAAVLVWYSTVTIYVAIKGARDIQQMFERLRSRQPADQTPKDNHLGHL